MSDLEGRRPYGTNIISRTPSAEALGYNTSPLRGCSSIRSHKFTSHAWPNPTLY